MSKLIALYPVKPIRIDGVIRGADQPIAMIESDVDVHTLSSMIRYGHVEVQEVPALKRGESVAPEEDGSSVGGSADPASDADSASSDAGQQSPETPDPGQTEDDSEPTPPSEPTADADLVAYWMNVGLKDSIAEAMAEASADPEVEDRELLKTVEGVREWLSKDSDRDLESLPKIGRVRAEAIRKLL